MCTVVVAGKRGTGRRTERGLGGRERLTEQEAEDAIHGRSAPQVPDMHLLRLSAGV